MPRGVSISDTAIIQRRLWTPAVLLPSLWLDASDLSTISTVSGAVSEWRDKSNNGRHAATAVRQPNYTFNVYNGLNGISFTRLSGHKLDTPNFSIAPNRQFCSFAVISGAGLTGAAGTFPRIWVTKGNGDLSAGGTTYQEGYLGQGSPSSTALFIAGGSGTISPQVTGLSATLPVLLSGRFGTAGIAANTSSISANGGTIVALGGQTGALSTTGIRIGSDVGTNSGSTFNSWMGEIILTTNISFAESQLVEGYLAWKWGIQTLLASNHPYINRPPLI
jgi:hypothetical protein